jgi:GTP-binding protein
MRFIDHCRIRVTAGDGGNGSVAFRREKFEPMGGPSGGDGGKGGDVVFIADRNLSTLQDVTYARLIKAERGEHGMGSDCYGRGGKDQVVRVPLGTQVFDETTGDLIVDFTTDGERMVMARGGRGGRGNIHFASAEERAPRRAEKGEPGEERELRLELKIMADAGLVGFPNVGKSTFVSSVSAARPKIADYPFTTLVPSLGVVDVFGGPRVGGTTFVIADIPGLVPGASEGTGLGIEFLKHVERCRVLLHLVTLDPGEERDPVRDWEVLRGELAAFSPELAERPEVVALSQLDRPEVRDAFPTLAARFAKRGIKLHQVSAVTREGLDAAIETLFRAVAGEPVETIPLPAAPRKKAATPEKKAAARKKASAPKRTKAAAPRRKAAAPRKKAAPKKKAATPTKKPAAKKKIAATKKPAAKKKVAPTKKPAAKKKVAPTKKPAATRARGRR